MGYQARVYPEIWLAVIAAIVFFPMMFILNQQSNFDLWRFSLLFALIIAVIYLYAFWEIKKSYKTKSKR
jgi:heme/copper-type cytochrome/quinol oxidase subunit 4